MALGHNQTEKDSVENLAEMIHQIKTFNLPVKRENKNHILPPMTVRILAMNLCRVKVVQLFVQLRVAVPPKKTCVYGQNYRAYIPTYGRYGRAMDIQSGWWFGTCFFHILGIITPTDFYIFQRGRSTTNHL